MSFGDLNFGGGQATSSKERLNRGKVGGRVGDAKLRANGSRMVELTTVALSVIDGQCMQIVACFAQMIEEDGRIEPPRIDDDGFHEFSGLAEWRRPGNSASRATVLAK